MTVLSVLSSFAIILLWKIELDAILQLCSCWHVAICALCRLLVVPWVDLWSVIVAFPCNTYLVIDRFSRILAHYYVKMSCLSTKKVHPCPIHRKRTLITSFENERC